MKPVASWRSNIVKRILPTGRLLKIGELGRTSRRSFTGDRPLAHYAQARTVFLYMWDRGVLGAWYARYTKDFRAEDAASVPGDLALAAVLGQTSDAVDRAYREWVRELPEVAEPIKPGAATIGVDVEAGSGDGPVIVGVPREILLGQRSPAAEAGLRVGDVILAVDGRPTAELNELVRIIGERAVGERVELTLRRGGERVRATVELTARRD
jgi:hypothetical protein